ncbi:MAG: Spore_coat_protein_CotH [uncultured Thermomicrobiales bacterium]|uniref:Spore_coat_protein_CotH n=1 Tax=uncultured Thermomicrobiales bacterium TaxID=1645740 RepID=A0A6J4TWI2_9BACT|nr:MAG: Spore_coat_protein_CotH [uncultured Thermomicrobiales bacterium]
MSRTHRVGGPSLSRRRFLIIPAAGALAAIPAGRSLAAQPATPSAPATGGTFLDAGMVHDVAVTFEQRDYDAMIETYATSGDKEWITATVAIDGATYPNVGMRLKGNSSLMGLRVVGEGESGQNVLAGGPGGPGVPRGPGGGVSADTPEGLPWLIRLDKYENGQQHDGIAELVIRANGSETSLNEAVALVLLGDAGLASQRAAFTAFGVNGGAKALRLAIEHPNDGWMAAHFSAEGLLYKSDASGDWTYRGDDPDAYKDEFDLEAGGTGDDEADMTPLIEFLDFVNNSDDGAFVAELPIWLDVDEFAVYLAMMDLVGNFDDIDGPGNNSYLYYAPNPDRFTVVPWDMNLAFGAIGNLGRVPSDGQPPEGLAPSTMPGPSGSGTPAATEGTPTGEKPFPSGGMRRVVGGLSNPLVERFTAVADFAALVDATSTSLRADLYGSGAADAVLDRWVGVLERGASTLVDQDTITAEADAIARFFTAA